MNYKYKVKASINLTKPRETIIEYLKTFPIGKWVSTSELKKMLRIKKINFLRNFTSDVYQKQKYGNWYDYADFEDFEYSFVDSVLMDYLAVMGIVDVTIEEEFTDYDNDYLSTGYIKLTEFGAMVLGLIKPVIKEEIMRPLIINDNYEIIVEESSKRMEYELYLERFLSILNKNEKETIYEFNFMV